jgi:hypothetical protein
MIGGIWFRRFPRYDLMNRCITFLFSILIAILSLSCSPWEIGNSRKSLDNTAIETVSAKEEPQVSFEDQTEEVVGHAERLIEKNEREGAVLDQRWYTLKRFGKYQDVVFSASQIVFYGGLEKDVRRQLQNQYASIIPVENDQDPGEIRLFFGERKGAQYDLIIIGQNGKEVALKTIIRLIYLAKFVDDETKRKYQNKLQSFNKSLKVLMSSRTAREEFMGFLNGHGISNPDAVMIGFIGDTRAILRDQGIEDPKSYSDESLRVNWYTSVNGMKVLLVSIDQSRIFASRSGELIDAILSLSGNKPPYLIFLGSGGAIDEPEIVGKIINPTIVLNGDPFPATPGVLVHIIRNRAINKAAIKTAHVSVENVVVETTRWATEMKKDRIRTVDQELFHIIKAINSSTNARRMEIFIGILVTDNVSSDAKTNVNLTLEHAEEAILKTAGVRKEFLSKILMKIGILKRDETRLPDRNEITR